MSQQARPLDKQYGARRRRRRGAHTRAILRGGALIAAAAPRATARPPTADVTYSGAPVNPAHAAKLGPVKERVLNYENLFSDVATHPKTSVRTAKCASARAPLRAAGALSPHAGGSARRARGAAARRRARRAGDWQ